MKLFDSLKKEIVLAIAAFAVFCIAPIIMLSIEPEQAEAIIAGLALGSVGGSVLGVAALLLNKKRNKLVVALSVIPICVFALLLAFYVLYLFYI